MTGLNHQLDNLTSLIRDALYLDRVPVLDPPRLHPRHNFGLAVSTDWTKYIDTAGICAYRSRFGDGPPGGVDDLEEVPVSAISADMLDTDLRRVTPALGPTERRLGDMDDEILIRRNMAGVAGSLWSNASVSPEGLFQVRVPPSRNVANFSLPVVLELGTYAAVHVRRGDRLTQTPGLDRDTSLPNIRRLLDPVVPASMPVYILSDEVERTFFDALAPRFKVRRFFEWPSLERIVTSAEPDNFMLYQIEKRIFDSAAIRVYTFRREGREHYLSRQYGWA